MPSVSRAVPRLVLRLPCWPSMLLGLCLAWLVGVGLGTAVGQRARALGLIGPPPAPSGLDQILGDGQPEDIGYGFQRARSAGRSSARSARNTARPDGLLLVERAGPGDGDGNGNGDEHITSAFRERVAGRQRRQRQQQQQQQQQQWTDWRRDNPGVPGVSSFYPAGGLPSEPVDNPERYLQALREAWARYQQQTGAIDVGPDDLTDMETLQFLESLGEDIPGARKRASSAPEASAPASAPASARQYASGPWDWAAPLAWSGYQLRKRSAGSQDDSGEWADGAGGADGGEEVVPGSRLAMLLSQQLFDERYSDPAVKRLLLAKRSLGRQQPTAEEAAGLEVHAMRRRKKSVRSEASVRADLARVFGEAEPKPDDQADGADGELEPPRALPLAAGPEQAASTAAPAADKADDKDGKNASTPAAAIPMNPIGHAHETDKIAREHAAHAHPAATAAPAAAGQAGQGGPNVHVKVHTTEHAPPMVSAEGPHSHDTATADDDKKPPVPLEKLPGTPAGAAAGPSGLVAGAQPEAEPRDARDEPLALPRRSTRSASARRLAKKSVDWSQYFGIDRRKKSLALSDDEENEMMRQVAQVDADWLMRQNLMALSKNAKPSNINKRVAIKREGASPDALLLGAWGGRGGWDDEDDDGEDDDDEGVPAGRCWAVTRLAESCRAAIGTNDGLLPLCVLYQACHLCGAAMGVPVGSSCEVELGRRGADLCAASAGEDGCRAAVEAIVQVHRKRQSRLGGPDTETCAQQPCLAHFFLSAPAVGFA